MSFAHNRDKRRSVSPSFSWQYSTVDYHHGSVPVRSRTRRPQRCSSVVDATTSVAPSQLIAAPDCATALLIYRKMCACHLLECPQSKSSSRSSTPPPSFTECQQRPDGEHEEGSEMFEEPVEEIVSTLPYTHIICK
ncbi:tight junction protein ZO-2 isoform X1 [Aphis craccivora]|uniref:Tight junction protein ZO-2 isoform X1 n=1 Tax=Aphis craccivora TaxID=307492 RepID=A0A6G0ZAV4_APHCR|nr:tight junction protein ZO-2 isoform X1 [Aphis craccivora]